MTTERLILKRASASRPSGEWNEDDFDLLADGAVVGRIFKANASPVGHRGCGHWPLGITKTERPHMAIAATREAAMAAFAKSWRRE
jgi:hypothetical protein